MGARMVKFDICPKPNEQLELTVKIPEEERSVVHGIVKDCNDKVVKDAVVKLFELTNPCNPCSAKPLTHTFTDECGQFIFGPLCPNKHYLIKIWYECVKITPLVIKPNCCKQDCLEHPHKSNMDSLGNLEEEDL